MKDSLNQGLSWLIFCLLGAVGAYSHLHVQPPGAGKLAAARAFQFALIHDADRTDIVTGNGPGPITDDPNARKCMCKLWQMSGYGFRQTEAAMDIVRTKDGSLSCRFWPFAHLTRATEAPGGNWPLEDVAAIAHTHPRKGTVQRPSDPQDYLRTVDDYVICADGIFTAEKGCTRKKDKKSCTQQTVGPKWYDEWCK